VIGGQDHGFGGFIVGGAAWILASLLFAVLALESQFAILGMTIADEMIAATMGAAQRLRKHRIILPPQTLLSHYRLA
jgi:hypothetical protein